jgi:hypothetical protein
MSFGLKDIIKFGLLRASQVAAAIISNATPQPLGTAVAGSTGKAADAGHVHAMPTGLQLNAMTVPGTVYTYNATTNTSSDSQHFSAETAPSNANVWVVTVAGTQNLGSAGAAMTLGVNDLLTWDGQHWGQQVYTGSVGTTGAIQKAAASGAFAAAVRGIDYASPVGLVSGVAIGIAPSGTVGSNGLLTLGTALALTYSDGLWLYFPANAITGANAAGFYWTVMSSTTVGTVYNTTYTPGLNSGAGSWAIPGSPTAFSGTTGAAYTGVTTQITALRLQIPAGALGVNGFMREWALSRANSSAGTKTILGLFGGTSLGISVVHSSTNVTGNNNGTSYVRGRADRQISGPAESSTGGGIMNRASVDSTQSQNKDITLQLATATDWITLEAASILYSAGPT